MVSRLRAPVSVVSLKRASLSFVRALVSFVTLQDTSLLSLWKGHWSLLSGKGTSLSLWKGHQFLLSPEKGHQSLSSLWKEYQSFCHSGKGTTVFCQSGKDTRLLSFGKGRQSLLLLRKGCQCLLSLWKWHLFFVALETAPVFCYSGKGTKSCLFCHVRKGHQPLLSPGKGTSICSQVRQCSLDRLVGQGTSVCSHTRQKTCVSADNIYLFIISVVDCISRPACVGSHLLTTKGWKAELAPGHMAFPAFSSFHVLTTLSVAFFSTPASVVYSQLSTMLRGH